MISEITEQGGAAITEHGEPVPRGAGARANEVAERLALALSQAGMQRMIARVLAAFLFSDRDAVTAGMLGEQLGASAGSISGAIRMLRVVGLIEQVPAPASRRDHYRMRPDAWATLMTNQNAMIHLMQEIGEAGLAAVPADSIAAERLRGMRDFYGYMLAELPALLDRWREAQPPDRPAGP